MKELPQENSKDEVQIDQLNFEAAFKQLEEIVAVLETEEKSLEDALALFERGQELARRCTELLDGAELRVQVLSGSTLREFNQEAEEI